LPEDERGELVDGQVVEEEAPNYVHEILVILLGSLLQGWFTPRGGFVGGSDAKLAVGPKQGRRPDLTVYFAGTPLPPPSGVIAQPPDIAIEIVSPTPRDGRRNRVEKVADYAAFGVRYYTEISTWHSFGGEISTWHSFGALFWQGGGADQAVICARFSPGRNVGAGLVPIRFI
jgi:Uma2 family endonuclease